VIAPADAIAIGIGGNVGTEAELVERFGRARDAVAALGPVTSGALYRTAPIGPDQPAFLNSAIVVVAAETSPDRLIAQLLDIERSLGRVREREQRWGPRPIDLDVLVWGTRTIAAPALTVPHPRLAGRRFALAPLADVLGPQFAIVGVGTIAELLARVADQVVERVAEVW